MNLNTSENIQELQKNEVFVFGSNEIGFHGGGAARQALMKFGAVLNEPIGLFGQSYAIPTKDHTITSLPLEAIKEYVEVFIEEAKEHPDLLFLVTEIGCGLAGYKPIDIAPFFKNVIEAPNIALPLTFKKILDENN